MFLLNISFIICILVPLCQGFVIYASWKLPTGSFTSRIQSKLGNCQEVTSPELEDLEREIIIAESMLIELKSSIEVESEILAKNEVEFGDMLAESQTDYERAMKRIETEKEIDLDRMKLKSIVKYLDVADDFDRAREAALNIYTSNEEKQIFDYYDGIFKKYEQIIMDFGAITIKTIGEVFDEECMDGAFLAPCDEYPKNTVFVELEKGYRSRFNQRCFRPALVGVSSGDEEVPFPDYSDIIPEWNLLMNSTDFMNSTPAV